ncbi:MAG: hypothetical protein WBP85_14060 [Terracidiphilus sp.]
MAPYAMRIKERNVERRTVIEAYATYDCQKKGQPLPDFGNWDWSRADAIDRAMCRAHLKVGIPAGYILWDQVELTLSDLSKCAVVGDMFPGQPRRLGLVARDQLARCRPGSWHGHITHGKTFDETAPMLLRVAVTSEAPALYYIEDGSGRAATFIANKHLFDELQTLAIGYLGRIADRNSRFMQQRFQELL